MLCCFLIFNNAKIALQEYRSKINSNYPFSVGDIQWHSNKIIYVTTISFFGGLLSSIVGVGGGIIFSPLLISLDMHPTVAVSTAIFVETFMVLTTTVQYIIANLLYTHYAIWLGFFSLSGTIIGLHLIHKIVIKLGKASIIIFLLFFVLVLAAIITIFEDYR